MELPKLPSLSLDTGSKPSENGGFSLSGIGGAIGGIADTVGGLNNKVIGAAFGGNFFGGVSIGNIVSIVVGLIFIMAAVLSFKSSRDVIIETGKTAAKTAALA